MVSRSQTTSGASSRSWWPANGRSPKRPRLGSTMCATWIPASRPPKIDGVDFNGKPLKLSDYQWPNWHDAHQAPARSRSGIISVATRRLLSLMLKAISGTRRCREVISINAPKSFSLSSTPRHRRRKARSPRQRGPDDSMAIPRARGRGDVSCAAVWNIIASVLTRPGHEPERSRSLELLITWKIPQT
jgi:hypothetical protein